MARLPHTDVRDLVATAERFSAALPALAGARSQRTADPPLERVREGLFYLGASCMDRVRELEAEGQRALADAVAPDLLRPMPAATILELTSEGGVQRVPAGAEVMTAGPRPCRFRTLSEVRVGPWAVEAARIESPTVLAFDLVASEGFTLADALGGARPRLFVDASAAGLRLLGHVLSHTSRAELSVDGVVGRLPLGPVTPYGMRSEHALAPEPDGPHTGLSLLREYFLLPEKFCFFGLAGLSTVLRGSPARRATVTLTFAEPLPAQPSGTPAIRAHCVPAVNLFRASAEPWIFEPGRTSAPVRVAGHRRDDGGVYAVLGASSTPCEPLDAEPLPLPPARRFAAGAPDASFPYAFSTRLATVPGRDEPELVVCLVSPRGRPPVLAAHVVSLDLLATNRDRAGRLRPGDLTEPGDGMPPGVRVRNITPCSPYVPPPVGPELALRAAVRAAVPDGDLRFALQSHLLAAIPRRGVDPAAVRGNVARVRAVQSVEAATVVDRVAGRRGHELRLVVDETPFHGLGDVALFTRLVWAALEAQAGIGRFYRCVATAVRSGARVAWPPKEPS